MRLVPSLFRALNKGPILPISSRQNVSSLTLTPRSAQSRLFPHFSGRQDDTDPISTKAPPTNLSLSQRLKHLIKSYGWYALIVYVFLSALDFALAFAAIHLIGAQHVAHVTHALKGTVHDLIYSSPPEPGRDELDAASISDTSNGGLYAMLVLAYTVHKTLFLPVRVGLTAWLTPRVVAFLTRRGWTGGDVARRAVSVLRESLGSPSRRTSL